MWLFRFNNLLLLLLIGCSITPLYSSKNAKVIESLNAIEIIDNSQENKKNFALIEQLKELLNLSNNSLPKKYILEIEYSNNLNAEFVRKSSNITDARISLNLKYVLKDKYSQKELSMGQLFSSGKYKVTQSELSTYTAENYTEQTLIKEILESLKESISITLFKLNYEN